MRWLRGRKERVRGGKRGRWTEEERDKGAGYQTRLGGWREGEREEGVGSGSGVEGGRKGRESE